MRRPRGLRGHTGTPNVPGAIRLLADKDNKWAKRNITRWRNDNCDKLWRVAEAESAPPERPRHPEHGRHPRALAQRGLGRVGPAARHPRHHVDPEYLKSRFLVPGVAASEHGYVCRLAQSKRRLTSRGQRLPFRVTFPIPRSCLSQPESVVKLYLVARSERAHPRLQVWHRRCSLDAQEHAG